MLVVNPAAGSIADGDLDRLSAAFPGCLVLTVGADEDFHSLLAGAALTDDALVVAVGGDGTVGAVARVLAGSRHPFGIIPRGTFNNFAQALGIPLDFDAALAVIQRGRPRPAAIGLFGEALALGEASKDLHYGDVLDKLRNVVASHPFKYRLSGDSRRRGEARSLVVANTPFTGARLEVGDSTPAEPYLELMVNVGMSRTDLLRRLVHALLQRPPAGHSRRAKVRRLRVETTPEMRVYADIDEAGQTPAEIEAVSAGLKVIR